MNYLEMQRMITNNHVYIYIYIYIYMYIYIYIHELFRNNKND